MPAKFSIPKFSEWQLFGKQPCVLFGSTRPKGVIEIKKSQVDICDPNFLLFSSVFILFIL
jgi:hypothetical protein